MLRSQRCLFFAIFLTAREELDLPGCTPAGKTADAAYRNGVEAVRLWVEEDALEDGEKLPRPRSLMELLAGREVRRALAAGAALIMVPVVRDIARLTLARRGEQAAFRPRLYEQGPDCLLVRFDRAELDLPVRLSLAPTVHQTFAHDARANEFEQFHGFDMPA